MRDILIPSSQNKKGYSRDAFQNLSVVKLTLSLAPIISFSPAFRIATTVNGLVPVSTRKRYFGIKTT